MLKLIAPALLSAVVVRLVLADVAVLAPASVVEGAVEGALTSVVESAPADAVVLVLLAVK
jgi:hypothetical protein